MLPGHELDVVDAAANLGAHELHERVEVVREWLAGHDLDQIGHVVRAGEGDPLRACSDEAGVPEQPPEPVPLDAVVLEAVEVHAAAGQVGHGRRRAG